MKIRAGAPSSRAAQATAWPWVPALAATTPAAPQPGAVRDRLREVPARPARRNREDLTREIRAAPLLELPALLEERTMLLDLLPQLGHVLAAHGLRQHDRRAPVPAPLLMRVTEGEDR